MRFSNHVCMEQSDWPIQTANAHGAIAERCDHVILCINHGCGCDSYLYLIEEENIGGGPPIVVTGDNSVSLP